MKDVPKRGSTIEEMTVEDSTAGGGQIEAPALKLFAWLSPSFPVGSFAFSHGLEWAVDAGDIREATDLRSWLDDLLHQGAMRADAVLLAATWRDPACVLPVNELALALAPSAERRLETSAQGNAFLAAVLAAWPTPLLERLRDALEDGDIAYPVALGLAAAAHHVPLRATLEASALATIANLISAALRLGVIGQSEGQRSIAHFLPTIGRLAGWAETAGLEDLGTCAWRSDLAAMRHETQYSRLFRS